MGYIAEQKQLQADLRLTQCFFFQYLKIVTNCNGIYHQPVITIYNEASVILANAVICHVCTVFHFHMLQFPSMHTAAFPYSHLLNVILCVCVDFVV